MCVLLKRTLVFIISIFNIHMEISSRTRSCLSVVDHQQRLSPLGLSGAIRWQTPCIKVISCHMFTAAHTVKTDVFAQSMSIHYYYYLLSIVSDDDFLRISCLQSGLSLAFLSQLPGGIPFRARFLLMVSLKQSLGLPTLRCPSLSWE